MQQAPSRRQALAAFYQVVAPDNVHKVDSILARYRGNEIKLVQNLSNKYRTNPQALSTLAQVQVFIRGLQPAARRRIVRARRPRLTVDTGGASSSSFCRHAATAGPDEWETCVSRTSRPGATFFRNKRTGEMRWADQPQQPHQQPPPQQPLQPPPAVTPMQTCSDDTPSNGAPSTPAMAALRAAADEASAVFQGLSSALHSPPAGCHGGGVAPETLVLAAQHLRSQAQAAASLWQPFLVRTGQVGQPQQAQQMSQHAAPQRYATPAPQTGGAAMGAGSVAFSVRFVPAWGAPPRERHSVPWTVKLPQLMEDVVKVFGQLCRPQFQDPADGVWVTIDTQNVLAHALRSASQQNPFKPTLEVRLSKLRFGDAVSAVSAVSASAATGCQRECAQCHRQLGRAEFSTNQWQNKGAAGRCKQCVSGVSQQRQAPDPFGSSSGSASFGGFSSFGSGGGATDQFGSSSASFGSFGGGCGASRLQPRQLVWGGAAVRC